MPDAQSPKRPGEARRLDGASALFLTQYYRPELIGSGPFCADLAEWMAGQGCDVTVVAGPPHYPQPDYFRDARETMAQQERIRGVRVERINSYIPKQRSASQRILSELSFALLGLWALLMGRFHRATLVLSLCPSIFTVALASIARRSGGRHVVIVHDIQSGLAKGLGLVHSVWLHAAMQLLERKLLNRADSIVVLTETMKEELRRMGVVAPIEVAPIWVDIEGTVPTAARPGRALCLLYSGNLGRKQGLDQILKLAQSLAVERPAVEVIIRGEGSERAPLQKRVGELNLTNVHFDALLPADRLAQGLADGDVHLVPQEPAAADYAVPSKIYSIMAAGRTFVATANPGSPLWRIRRASRAFITVRANDHGRLLRTVKRLLDDGRIRHALGARGRHFIEDNCAREKVFGQLANLFWNAWEPPASSLLIVEPDADGHQLEWLRHLMRHAAEELFGRVTWFVVGLELFDELSVEAAKISGNRVRVAAITPLEATLCRSANLTVSGFARWWIARRFAALTRADSVHVLQLDHLTLPLALGLGAAGRPLSGTLFRPSVHYRLLGAYRPSRGERLRDLRKSILYRLMLLNPALNAVYSLDPFFPDFARRAYHRGDKVYPIHDPAHPDVTVIGSQHRLADAMPSDRTIFLLFGYLTDRKGTRVVLDALQRLAPGFDSRVAVMLAGRIDPAIRDKVLQMREELMRERPDLWIGIEDRRLAPGELEALVQKAHVLLAPYQRFVGSSGVLMWAARSGKPILTQDFGVMGAIVRELALGKTTDTTSALALGDAMMDMMTQGPRANFDAAAALTFSQSHTPRAFASAILASREGHSAGTQGHGFLPCEQAKTGNGTCFVRAEGDAIPIG